MSGHSKWSTIKRQKGVADIKRGQQFSKLSKAITVAAKQGGGDPAANPRLRIAIEAARAASMPKDNINRAIDKAVGSDATTLEDVRYEGYGPGGAALLMEVVTDNRNRTVAEIRSLLTKHGGSLGEAGSVAWMFQPVGTIILNPTASQSPDEIALAIIEAGALDFSEEDGRFMITTEPANLPAVAQALEPLGDVESDLQLISVNDLELNAVDHDRLLAIVELLEDHDDVQRVTTNATL